LQLARWYARRRVASAFDGLFVEGLDAAREACRDRPLVVAMNHVSWWDPFVVVLLDCALGAESYCLMDRRNLDRMPFFGWIGAVPIHRDDPRQALADLKWASTLLDRPRRLVWIFPQGSQRPAHLRPLGLQRGVSILAAERDVDVLPVSLTYAYREAPQPSLAVSFGPPVRLTRGRPDALEERMVAGLARNDAFLTFGRGEHAALVAPSSPGSLPFAGRVLAGIGGGRRA
jgi:1-acyl-sn-glycerol-3-phosphate acyltransferase